MLQERAVQIQSIANKLHSALALSIPVNVEEAVGRLQGNIEVSTDRSLFHGSVLKTGERAFIISVPTESKDHRFDVAYLVGSLFLHMGYLTDKWASQQMYRDSPRYRYGWDGEEFESTRFAEAFLMPQFHPVLGVSLEEAAQYFGVPTETVLERLRW